ncbi:MAG: SAM-dependent methyltransferase [Oscillospiraceae bacterium]|nr:SAM-dependent methyltransferase [Oscillospiraceae bacterium]
MKLPISNRLLKCAELIPACDTVADVGTDHGYLGVWLLQKGRCRRVIASDLRAKPLDSARKNAALYAVDDRMTFLQSDGLREFIPGSFQTLVLAGMGGDLISRILEEAAWLEGGAYRLILQPQSAANDLRRFLGERLWSIDREVLVRDGHFLYSVLSVSPEKGSLLTPGEQYVSPALRREQDPLFPDYLARMIRALELTVSGITQSTDPADRVRAAYYRAALEEVRGLERSMT